MTTVSVPFIQSSLLCGLDSQNLEVPGPKVNPSHFAWGVARHPENIVNGISEMHTQNNHTHTQLAHGSHSLPAQVCTHRPRACTHTHAHAHCCSTGSSALQPRSRGCSDESRAPWAPARLTWASETRPPRLRSPRHLQTRTCPLVSRTLPGCLMVALPLIVCQPRRKRIRNGKRKALACRIPPAGEAEPQRPGREGLAAVSPGCSGGRPKAERPLACPVLPTPLPASLTPGPFDWRTGTVPGNKGCSIKSEAAY